MFDNLDSDGWKITNLNCLFICLLFLSRPMFSIIAISTLVPLVLIFGSLVENPTMLTDKPTISKLLGFIKSFNLYALVIVTYEYIDVYLFNINLTLTITII